MEDLELLTSEKVVKKTKKSLWWSAFGEVFSKIAAPLTNIVLARILAPEIFGIVAGINVVIAFGEMFSDTGFSKYLIQHDFGDKDKILSSASVAFWANMTISIIVFTLIAIFRNQLAIAVGCSGYGNVLMIAAIQIPLYGFCSLNLALLRRNFKFNLVFIIRVITIIIKLVLSIILAFVGLSYWALVIASVSSVIVEVIATIIFSKWLPTITFDWQILKKMVAESSQYFAESLLVWLNHSIDVFILGFIFTATEIGLFKNAISTEQGFMQIITAVFFPVLFSAFSRLKGDESHIKSLFSSFLHFLSFLVIPIGVGVFVYRDFLTLLLFGPGWEKAALVLGLFTFLHSLKILTSDFATSVYFSRGKPFFSIITQILLTIMIVVGVVVYGHNGFEEYVIARSITYLVLIITPIIFMNRFQGFALKSLLLPFLKPFILSSIMGVAGFFIQDIFDNVWWKIGTMIMCVLIYFLLFLTLFRNDFKTFIAFLFKFKSKR